MTSRRTPNEVLRKRGGEGNGHRLSAVPVGKPLARASRKRPPKPPRPLEAAGTDLWRRVWTAGVDWVSPDTDLERVLVLCEMTDEYVALRRRATAPLVADDVPLTGGEKRTYDTLRDLRKQMADALASLGFSPTDRARLNVGEVAPEDPLETFQKETA